ncbi:hypothetical protein [Dethiothermospora halolimnae]|uniref:hypothetical protein n=1 Tax=Dethiothermospora halolimnae TaxID=3114390 RepID=UPI003CCBD647
MINKKDEYRNFVSKHFPYSGLNNSDYGSIIYSRVCENNLVTDIYKKYIEKQENDTKIYCNIRFLEAYKIGVNKILLYVPLNDYASINFCMRNIIENLLKFIYSIYFNCDFTTINKLSFRKIKDNFKDLKTTKFIDKDIIDLFLSYYGHFSNSIHDKHSVTEKNLVFLEEIITKNKVDLEKLDEQILNILNNYQVLICNIFKISRKNLSVAESLRLKNALSNKRLEKVMGHFYG